MVNTCVVFGCNFSYSRRKQQGKLGVSIHQFPVQRDRREEWIKVIRRQNWQPSSASGVCSQHFRPEDMDLTGQTRRLKAGAVPSIFPAYSLHLQKPLKMLCQQSAQKDVISTALNERTKQRSTAKKKIKILQVEDLQNEVKTVTSTTLEELYVNSDSHLELAHNVYDIKMEYDTMSSTFTVPVSEDEDIIENFKEEPLSDSEDCTGSSFVSYHVKTEDGSAQNEFATENSENKHDADSQALKYEPNVGMLAVDIDVFVKQEEPIISEMVSEHCHDEDPLMLMDESECHINPCGLDGKESIMNDGSAILGTVLTFISKNQITKSSREELDKKDVMEEKNFKLNPLESVSDYANNSINTDLGNHEKGQFSILCNKCNETFSSDAEHKSHQLIHPGDCSFVCNVCNKSYGKRNSLNRHLLLHTSERSFLCDICNKGFKRKIDVNRHKERHTTEPSFVCHTCNKAFKRKIDVTRHQLVHNSHRPFICNICNKSFPLKYHLKEHKLVHMGERPFRCTICGKAFKQRSGFNHHKIVHVGLKFPCNLCNKVFSRKSVLKEHLLIHNNEHAFVCNVCNKTFTQKTNLTQHKLLHSGQRLFSCNVCKKPFTQKCHLKIHEIVHTNESLFKCTICKKTYKHKNSLKKHKLQVHS